MGIIANAWHMIVDSDHGDKYFEEKEKARIQKEEDERKKRNDQRFQDKLDYNDRLADNYAKETDWG